MLPVAHPELNPIELAWSFLKRSVAAQTTDFKLAQQEQKASGVLSKIDSDVFTRYVCHVLKEEKIR